MSKLMKKVAKGFTLIELMIVVAIIGILAAIAIPKFADLVTKSKEASIKGSLGSVRSAVSIYYSDNEGVNPGSSAGELATALTANSRYLQELPAIAIPNNTNHSSNHTSNRGVDMNVGGGATANDAAGGSAWYYNAGVGHVAVNCSHRDTKGSSWSTW